MKRHLAILLAILMVLGIAAVATAGTVESKGDTKITLGGDIRIRGEYMDNQDDFNKSIGTRRAYFDQRVRLALDAQTGKNTKGRIVLESGTAATGENFTWGPGAGDVAGVYKKGNTRPTQMYILEAWLEHKFDMGLSIKAGHMPIKLGRGLFLDHSKFGDDAIIIGYAPTKELSLALAYAKLSEGSNTGASGVIAPGINRNNTWSASDADLYALIADYKLNKDMGFGLNVAYLKDNDNLTAQAGNTHAKTDLWNIGLNTDLAFGPVTTYADINIQTGKMKNFNKTTFQYDQTRSMSLKGWAMLIGMAYDMKPFKFRMEYAYGSGDDMYNPTANIPAGSAYKGFVTTQSNVVKYTYVYDYRTLGATGALNNGITNTNYIRLGVDYAATKDLMMKLDYFWLRASKKVALANSFGRASLDANNNPIVSNELGHEVDWNINYKITPNLQYYVEGGYLFAGKAYNTRNFTNTVNKSADDIWAIRHGIQLSF